MKSLQNILQKKQALAGRGVREEEKKLDEKTLLGVFLDAAKGEMTSLDTGDVMSVKDKDGTVYVKTVHPAIASEIWRRREGIRKKMNALLGKETISNIHVK